MFAPLFAEGIFIFFFMLSIISSVESGESCNDCIHEAYKRVFEESKEPGDNSTFEWGDNMCSEAKSYFKGRDFCHEKCDYEKSFKENIPELNCKEENNEKVTSTTPVQSEACQSCVKSQLEKDFNKHRKPGDNSPFELAESMCFQMRQHRDFECDSECDVIYGKPHKEVVPELECDSYFDGLKDCERCVKQMLSHDFFPLVKDDGICPEAKEHFSGECRGNCKAEGVKSYAEAVPEFACPKEMSDCERCIRGMLEHDFKQPGDETPFALDDSMCPAAKGHFSGECRGNCKDINTYTGAVPELKSLKCEEADVIKKGSDAYQVKASTVLLSLAVGLCFFAI